MRAKIHGRTIEIPDERVADGRADSRRAHGNAGSNPAPSPLPGWPKASDKWNYAFAQFLELEKQAGRVKHWYFEPFSMWLPGEVRFKPDFLIQYPDGLERKLEFVEVKGWSRNLRDGITRYKIAAALFPCFDWKMVKRKNHGWEEYS